MLDHFNPLKAAFMQRFPALRLLRSGARTAAALLAAHCARADNATWNGTADALWATVGNWSASPVPGAGNTATFDNAGGADDVISLGGGVTIAAILFDTASAAAYTIGSGGVGSQALTLDNNGSVTMSATVAAGELFNARILLGTATAGSFTFTNNSTTNALTFAGSVQGGTGGTAGAKTLTINGTGDTTISGSVANGGASSLALSKSGTGTLTLSGRNTYTGATSITGGAIRVQDPTALGTTSGVTVASGAALQIQGTFTIDRALTLNGTGVSNDGALRNISGVGKYSGNITLGSATRISSDAGILRTTGTLNTAGFGLTVGGAGDTSLWGVVSGAGGVTMDGTGMLKMAAAHTYTGVTNINSGTVFLNVSESVNASGPMGKQLANAAGTIVFGGGTLQYSAVNTNDYSGRFSTAAGQAIKIDTSSQSITFATPLTSPGGSLTVSGAGGTLALTALGTYSGATTVQSGTLALNLNAAAGNNVVSASSALTLGGNLNVIGTGGTTVRSQTFNGTTFNPGNATITPTLNAASTTANVLTLDLGPLSRNAGGTSNIVFTTGNTTTTNTQINTGSGSADALITDASGVAYLTFGTSATSIRDWAVKDAGNTRIIQAPGSFYTAATGTSIAGHADIGALSPTITGAVGDNAVASIRFDNAGARTLTLNGATSTFSVGGILVSSNVGNNATVITGTGTLQGPGAGAGDLVIHNWDTSSSARIDSIIGGSGGFTKSGTGTVVLNGANTYTGPTTIGGGILQVGNGGTTGDLGGTTGTITNNGTLTFNRSSAASPLTIANAITGTGGLTQQGAGTTILQGALSYRGLTTVNAGTLTFASGSSRKFTSRGNTNNSNRGMDGNGLQVNNGTVNIGGLVDVENLYITGGVINVLPGGELLNRQSVGNGFFGFSVGGNEAVGAAYGMLNMTGGTVSNVNDLVIGNGPRFGVGIRGTAAGLVRVSGGTLNAITLLANSAEITQLGGSIRTAGGNAPFLNTSEGNNNTGNATTVLNVAGGLFDNGTLGLNVGGGTAGSSKVVINLNSGTLWTQAITQLNGSQAIMNFNGGTLKAGAASATFTPAPVSNTTSTFTSYVSSGGAVIDTNNFNITIPSNLLAPTGSGVSSLPVTTGGSGYVGAPMVAIADAGATQPGTTTAASNTILMADTAGVFVGQSITGTGIPPGSIVTGITADTAITISQNATTGGSPTLTFKGQGATAFATISGGVVSGYVVTNPGVGYVGVLSATLSGGTASGGTAATINGAEITTASNTSGGFTKDGAGTLTLSGSTTFTAPTLLNAGTLAFGNTITNTFPSPISGQGALTQSGTGATILTGTNTHFGATTVSSGALQISSLTNLSPNSNLLLAGGVLQLGGGLTFDQILGTAAGQIQLANNGGFSAIGGTAIVQLNGGAPLVWGVTTGLPNGIAIVFGHTTADSQVDFQNDIDLQGSTRTLTVNLGTGTDSALLSGVISNSSGTAGLAKQGAGTLILSADNTYNGTTTVTGGRLILSGNNSAATGGMTLTGGITQFNSVNSINGTLRNVTVTSPASVIFGPAFGDANIPAALLDRIVPSSTGAIAADNHAATDFDFNAAGLTAASLGAAGNVTFSGNLTPHVTGGYRLGGSGGTLTMGNTNALTGANTLDVKGNVILAALNDNTGVTTVNAGATLTLGAGITGQNGSVGGNITSSGALVFNNSDSQSFGGIISGSSPLTKNGTGELTFTAPHTYTGTTAVNAGALVLAGGDHTLAVNKPLIVNGGTLSLGTNRQYAGTLNGTGGIITGTGGTLTTNGAGTFAGSFQGSVNLVNVGGSNMLTLTGDSTTTGSASLLGGDVPQTQPGTFNGLTLKDGGRLSGMTAINLNNGSLFIDNAGTANNNDRINDSAAITLDGGRIIFTGRASTASAETFGAVTARTGLSTISATAGASGSAELTLASLTRNTGATLKVEGTNLGQLGNNGRIIVTGGPAGNLTQVNGVVPGVVFKTGADALQPVGYIEGQGFGSLGTSGFPAYFSPGGNNFTGAGPASNVQGNGTVTTGTLTINSLRNGTITFTNAGDTLILGSGMYVQGSNASFGIGSATTRGVLTSGLGTGELFLFKMNEGSGGAAAGNIHSVIADNGATRVKLILSNFQRDNLNNQDANLTAGNTHTGGTVVSGGNIVFLTATNTGETPIPSAFDPAQGLIIDNSTVTMVSSAQQIAASNIVTLNGGSVLNLAGANNTLAGIVFNSSGGKTTPAITGGTQMTVTGNITSTPSDLSFTPLISTVLDFNGTDTHDITVAALPEGNYVNSNTLLNGLSISSAIQNGGFTKKGAGVLNLTGNNTFSGQLTVEEGVLNVATINNASANGVLGNSGLAVILGRTGGKTGTLEYTGGTTASSKNFTLASGGTGAFQVDNAAANLTLGGALNGGGTLAKNGPGTLTLSSPANFNTGDIAVNAGTLVLADNAGLMFLVTDLGSNRVIGSGTAIFNGDFTIQSFAVSATSGSWSLVSVATLNETFASTFSVVGYGDPENDGSWTLLDGTRIWTFTENTGVLALTSTGPTPYDTWAADRGLTGANNAPGQDADGDGHINLAEFAFDGDPLNGSDNMKVFARTEDSDIDGDATKELVLTVAVRAGTPAFSGTTPPTASHEGITYEIEASGTQPGFTALTAAHVVGPLTSGLPVPGAGYEYRSFSLDGSNGLPGTGFFRAKVSAP